MVVVENQRRELYHNADDKQRLEVAAGLVIRALEMAILRADKVRL